MARSTAAVMARESSRYSRRVLSVAPPPFALACATAARSTRRCLHLAQPDHGAGEMDKAHEGWERLFAAQGNAAEAFQPVEEALDLVALLVELPVDSRLVGAARIGLDLRAGPEVVGDEGAERVGVVGSIGDDVTDALQAGQERLGLRAVAVLARCRVDANGQAERVNSRVQLGGQATARAADGGSPSPPFAPVASA